MAMHAPMHPGEVLRDAYLVPMRQTITGAARALGVTRKHVSSIVHGRASVTPQMATRLGIAFGTEPGLWLNLQRQRDLWLARQKARPKVKAFRAA